MNELSVNVAPSGSRGPRVFRVPQTREGVKGFETKQLSRLKAEVAGLGLKEVRAEGWVARALRGLPDWPALELACLAPGERVVAMLGKAQPEAKPRGRVVKQGWGSAWTERLSCLEAEQQVSLFARLR